jgi:hypothetical protein
MADERGHRRIEPAEQGAAVADRLTDVAGWDNTASRLGEGGGTVRAQDDRQQVREDLERFTQDMVYFDRRREKLLRQYPDRWVAVYR